MLQTMGKIIQVGVNPEGLNRCIEWSFRYLAVFSNTFKYGKSDAYPLLEGGQLIF
jgi:hypothetical protein